jgi:hypothetical protein
MPRSGDRGIIFHFGMNRKSGEGGGGPLSGGGARFRLPFRGSRRPGVRSDRGRAIPSVSGPTCRAPPREAARAAPGRARWPSRPVATSTNSKNRDDSARRVSRSIRSDGSGPQECSPTATGRLASSGVGGVADTRAADGPFFGRPRAAVAAQRRYRGRKSASGAGQGRKGGVADPMACARSRHSSPVAIVLDSHHGIREIAGRIGRRWRIMRRPP